jgi:hypothetical protein
MSTVKYVVRRYRRFVPGDEWEGKFSSIQEMKLAICDTLLSGDSTGDVWFDVMLARDFDDGECVDFSRDDVYPSWRYTVGKNGGLTRENF